MRIRRAVFKAAVPAAAIIILFAAFELTLRIAQGPQERRPVYENAYRQNDWLNGGPLTPNLSDLLEFDGQGAQVPDPIFGFHQNRRRPGINNYGLESPYDYPYQKKPGELVLAVFGGSVAGSWAKALMNSPGWRKLLLKLIAGERFEKLVVLNMAQGGQRQPQQFHLAAMFLGSYDLAISIEGFNDAVLDSNESLPVEYPPTAGYFFEMTKERNDLVQEMRSSRKVQALMTSWALTFPRLAESEVCFFLWSRLMNLAGRRHEALVKRFSAPVNGIPFAGHFRDLDRSRALIDNWAKYIELQNSLLKAKGIPHLVIIQPNQYAVEEAPAPPEGERVYLTDKARARWYVSQLAALRDRAAHGADLSGVPIKDLAGMFASRKHKIFIDDCCHLNRHGNMALMRAILLEVAKRDWKPPATATRALARQPASGPSLAN